MRGNPHIRDARLLLALLCGVQFVVVADLAIVNVALPTIRERFDASQAELQWVSGIYALGLGGFLLVGGRAADALGARRVLLAGLGAFAVASLACGLAGSMDTLIGARALQGLGAAFVAPAALAALTNAVTEPAARRRALAAWTTSGVLGGVAGYVLGGAATATVGWEVALVVQAPLAGAVALVARRIVPDRRPDRARARVAPGPAAVATVALLAAIYGLTSSTSHGWLSPHALGALALAAALGAWFRTLELRSSSRLVPRDVAASPAGRAANALSLVLGATGAAFFFVTQYLQNVHGHGPGAASLLLLVLPVAIVVGAQVLARCRDRIPDRRAIALGLALVAAGLVLLGRAPGDGGFVADVLPGALLFGLGRGLALAPVTGIAVASAPRESAGVASGLVNASSQVGAALGLAVLVTAGAGADTGQVGVTAEQCRLAFLAAAVLALGGVVLAARWLRASGPDAAAARPDAAQARR